MKKIPIIIILLCLVLLTLKTFLVKSNSELESTYKAAGKNKNELKRVIEHYEKLPIDAQKLDAANFLIAGLSHHYSISYAWYNTKNTHVEIKPKEFESNDDLDLFVQSNNLKFRKDTFLYHPEILTRRYIIDNIDQSFEAWRKLPWVDSVPFSDFKEYVLPYSLGNEIPESWRQYFQTNYKMISDSIISFNDPVKTAQHFLKVFGVWHWYSDRSSFLSPHQSFSDLFKFKCVECTNYAHLITMACRSYGIATAIDEVPLWGNRNSAHCECSVLSKDGEWISLGDPIYSDISYDGRRAAKVFRRTYSPQNSTLVELGIVEEKNIPPLLRNRCYVDATSDYSPAQDVSIELDTMLPSESVVYSSVFNNNRWQAVHWANIDRNNKALFTKLVPYVVYLPSFYKNGEYLSATFPFIVSDNGEIVSFDINNKNLNSIQFTEGKLRQKLNRSITNEDKIYLYIWDGKWKYYMDSIVKNEKLLFNEIPSKAIFKLESLKNGDRPRIFSVEQNNVNWW